MLHCWAIVFDPCRCQGYKIFMKFIVSNLQTIWPNRPRYYYEITTDICYQILPVRPLEKELTNH